MKTKRAKACDIPQKVKNIVWERDNHCCIICGSPNAMPNAHYIPRSQGGLGIEENIVTLCLECHRRYDQSSKRPLYGEMIKEYLKRQYTNWNEKDLVYRGMK
jgi:5-methylcytosine-specific restriction endonuclease McrA